MNAQTWQWEKKAGGIGGEVGYSISTDANGNSYVVGIFASSTIVFGSITLYNTANNTLDLFIVKYDQSGNVIWAKSAGGSDMDEVYGICTDLSGNSYVTGKFWSPFIVFGNDTLVNADNSGNTNDIFIVKFDSSGSVIWAERFGGNDFDGGYGIALGLNNSFYLTGRFYSPVISFDTITLSTSGGYDIFIAKFDTSGNVVWAKNVNGSDWDFGASIALDLNGNAFITGSFYSSTLAFDTIILTNSGTSNTDFFIAKYDSSGNILWAKSAGGTGTGNPEVGCSITLDSNGNVLVTGFFGSPMISFDSVNLLNAGTNTTNVFMVKYNSSGNVLWAKSFGGTLNEFITSSAMDANGNYFITGSYQSPAIAIDTITLFNTGGGTADIYIAKLDSMGNAIWAKTVGGNNDDNGMSLSAFPNGDVGMTGGFSSNPIYFDSHTLSNSGSSDFYIAKIGNTTGVEELNENADVKIYPNPVLDNLKVMVNSNELSEFILYDIASRKILQQKFTNSTSINTELLAKGIYIYEVRSKSGPDSYRVVKKGKIVKD